jgi:8-oxo-dGTP pyrophosphatase MutT (NUDIX family)
MDTLLSYGILLFTIRSGELLFFVARRRYSYAYIEFLLAKLKKERKSLIDNMTHKEIRQILNYKLEELWSDIYLEPFKYSSFRNSWKRTSYRRYMIDVFRQSKKKYGDELRVALAKEIKDEAKKVLYEFPKGKRDKGEDGIKCALREFKEETGISAENFVKINDSFTDIYIGEDGKEYVSILYPMFVQYNKIESIVNSRSECIISGACVSPEIESIFWLTEEECEKVLSPDKMKFVRYVKDKISVKDVK